MYTFIYRILCAISILIASITPYNLYGTSEPSEIEYSSITCEITDDADDSESEELRALRIQLEKVLAQMADQNQRPSFNVHATCWTANTHFVAQLLAKYVGKIAAETCWPILLYPYKQIWQIDDSIIGKIIKYAYHAIGYVCTMTEWSATVDAIRAGIETEPSCNTQEVVKTTVERAIRLAAATCASSFMTTSIRKLFF